MALIERDARRMAAALEDYTFVEVTCIGKCSEGYEIEFADLRAGTEHVITSHFDYWDFLGYFVNSQVWPARAPVKSVA